MIRYLKVDGDVGVVEGSATNYNWLLLNQDAVGETLECIKKYQLPNDIFLSADSLGEVARIESLEETTLTHPLSLVFFNLSNEMTTIENRIEPISFVLSDELLITYVGKNSPLIDELLTEYSLELTSFEQIILATIARSYTHFIAELKEIKHEIDALDQAARETTGKKELFQLANLDRKIILLDYTLSDQNDSLNNLWKHERFVTAANNPSFIFDIQLQQAQALKRIKIYHALIDTLGSLFESMISNNLNHLMKYLESAALVLTVPTLIAGIWGMNTGGLPFEEPIIGFFVVLLFMIILTILTAIFLAKKNYFK